MIGEGVEEQARCRPVAAATTAVDAAITVYAQKLGGHALPAYRVDEEDARMLHLLPQPRVLDLAIF